MKVELFKGILADSTLIQSQNTQAQISRQKPKETIPEHEDRSSTKLLDKERLNELAESLRKFLRQFDLEAKVVYDKKYETLVVQVLRKDTGELIKQIPPEELLEISRRLQELVGILLRYKS